MRVLAVDYGSKRVGLALSDTSGAFAFPLETIATNTALAHIADLVRTRDIDEVVMGDTRSYNDKGNPVTVDAESFAARLEKEIGKKIALVFEAGSSMESTRFTEGKGHDDAAAAAIILQRYLDTKK